jgi:type 1 glutamine amidotransferase
MPSPALFHQEKLIVKTKPFVWRMALVALFAGLAGVALAALAEVDPYDQSGVPLEKQPTDASLTKIVLVAGRASHGPREHEFFAGSALLMKLLQETPGVYPVMARDGWPKHPEETFKDAKAVVFYMDGGSGHPILAPTHMEELKKLMDAKVGFVNLHYAVEYPKMYADPILSWLGGYYETAYSINPTWTAEIKSLPDHPITRGVKPFTIKDEWYYNIRFVPDMKEVTPILKATPPDNTRGTADAKAHPGREEVLAWAFDRANGGRSFGFTGGHFHDNWGDENFRRLVVNAILWSANVEAPKEGAKVDLDKAELDRNLDRKGKQK